MQPKLLLVTPPLTQLNTPYPGTAFLKGFLNQFNYQVNQADLGIEFIHGIFNSQFLTELFNSFTEMDEEISEAAVFVLENSESYIQTVDAVIRFLQGKEPTISTRIAQRIFLPEGARFQQTTDMEQAFGTLGITDKAKYIATLYLEDIGDFISECISPRFGFSRYAEAIAHQAATFDALYDELAEEPDYLDELMLDLLDTKIQKYAPTVVGFSVPFPGNLYGALRCAWHIRNTYPHITLVMGGGYPNTELREITEPRFFEFIDYLTLDDGEAPMLAILEYLNGNCTLEGLSRTFICENELVRYINNPSVKQYSHAEIGTPDYSDLPLDTYISFVDMPNPMHRLWNDGRWNKFMVAHGCYWSGCNFCDISLDYIKRFSPIKASMVVDRMEAVAKQTGQTGFHFVDEAAPPKVLRNMATEILQRHDVFTWWGNIRFERNFDYHTCQLLAQSGCIAVTGGLEVASPRLLKLINKGVDIEQVAHVCYNFKEAGIMVHAYLMYGFAGETVQETIDSLEVVRQMFHHDLVQSAFWHRLAVTTHSPLGREPAKFGIELHHEPEQTFAKNDIAFTDPLGVDHSLYKAGLEKALYNFMHGIGTDYPIGFWFEIDVPETTISPKLISKAIKKHIKSGKDVKD